MTSLRVAVARLAAACGWASAMSGLIGPASASAQQLVRGPYLQSASDVQIVVAWRTDVPTNSRVKYGASPGQLDHQVDDPASVTNHFVTLTGLTPNTRLYYSIGSSTVVLAGGDDRHFFVTSPPPGRLRETHLWVIGDGGTKDGNARAVRNSYYNFSGSRKPDLLLLLGDNAYNNGSDSDYQDAVFENMLEERLIDTPLWPTFGNHDAVSADSNTQTGAYYDIFSLPKSGQCGGVASGTEAYYAFDHGTVHFICLDSSESSRSSSGPMLTWLDQDLAANEQEWVIAFWHHPPYSKGSHDSDGEIELIEMRQNAAAILEGHGVDLVLAGHSHSLERSFLIDGHYGSSSTFDPAVHGKDMGDGRQDGTGAYAKSGAGMTAHEGTVYVVCGCSGKISSAPLNHPAMAIDFVELGSLALDCYGGQMDVRFLDTNAGVIDHFTLRKGGATSMAAIGRVAVPAGSIWKYHDKGQDLGTSWRDPAFNDSAWAQGPAPLGYGESWIKTTVSFGGNANNKHITTYFRTTFDLAVDPAELFRLCASVNFDDGFVLHLNGTEVVRRQMPTGTIDWKTLATSHEAGTPEPIDFGVFTSLLVPGTNVLAVEVHQDDPASSDLVLDLEQTYDAALPYLTGAAASFVDRRGGIGEDVLRINGSTGGIGRSVDLPDLGSLTIAVDRPAAHPGVANFALFAWIGVPTEADRIPLGSVGELCFPPIFWVANNLSIGPPGLLPSVSAPWSYTEPVVGGPITVAFQAVIEERDGKLRSSNAVLVNVK